MDPCQENCLIFIIEKAASFFFLKNHEKLIKPTQQMPY